MNTNFLISVLSAYSNINPSPSENRNKPTINLKYIFQELKWVRVNRQRITQPVSIGVLKVGVNGALQH